MITIDGSQGEGGGQIVRSSLALSLITGIPIRIENVRAGRKNPGLLRQHLTAFQAATQISNAQTHGAELGSKVVQFEPGTITPGRYRFSVGSAGSTTLVFQTVLPALMLVDGISHIEVEGGTHNPHAPPFDYLARVYFPLLRKLGANVEAGNCHPGFYPAGGGCFGAKVVGCPSLNRLELLDRGVLLHRRVRALVANLPIDIAERECRLIERRTNWDAKNFSREEIEGSVGAGNVVMIELEFEHLTELFIAFGKTGKRAERVANEVLRSALDYIDQDVPVGTYLADQLLLPMGLAAAQGQSCVFRTGPLSQHARTQIDVLMRFLKIKIVVQADAGAFLVRLRPP
ncbi:MAG: RNA 3'-terminal phosphate cyclase [Planctomycetaceae bacterium]|nr:RNA 3'-terminal phosphate cyclase [Planctomycetales bacterium]MCB9925946.1 RNA 3'-terminal phosphate cyclase [Planctomycetaceae bacterium]